MSDDGTVGGTMGTDASGDQASSTHDVVVRVWMDDRPGALGSLAARIGAVGGNLVGIEILERGAGRVIDELVVSLPDDGLVDLLVREMQQVEGVDVETVRPVTGIVHDRHVDLLDLAVAVVGASTPPAVLRSLCDGVVESFGAKWAAVVDPAVGVLGGCGDRPSDGWVTAFVDGSRGAPDASIVGGEILAIALEPSGFVLVVDREGEPFRERECRWIVSLARVAGASVGRG